MPDAVRYAVAKRVAHIVLDRPPVNALSLDMIRAVIAALRQAAADDEARAVVLSSAVARHFCAGLDLAVLLGKSRDQVFEFVHSTSSCMSANAISASRRSRRSAARRAAAA